MDGPPPVVLVSLDTLRADRLGAYGNDRGLTPNLDRFAAEAVLFEDAYAQATITAPSHAAIFTSRYPVDLFGPVNRAATPPADTRFLAEILKVYGYRTGAFVAGGDLSPELGLTRGFDTYTSTTRSFASLWHTAPAALAWLDEQGDDAPTFTFVHGYDAHTPYLKPAPFGFLHAEDPGEGPGRAALLGPTERIVEGRLLDDTLELNVLQGTLVHPLSAEGLARIREREGTPLAPADLELVRDVYDGAVSYADAQFGLLMAGLQERGMLDEAVVVVLSDHGEQLGERGIFNHCCGVGDEETHVVLMVRMPGGGVARRVDGLVELVDVLPTVLDLVGATPPAGMRGRSLAPALRGEPWQGRTAAFSQGGLSSRVLGARGSEGRLAYEGPPVGFPGLPDFIEAASLPGPHFTVEGDLDAATQERLRGELVAWTRSLSPARGGGAAPLPETLVKELREHGYFGNVQ